MKQDFEPIGPCRCKTHAIFDLIWKEKHMTRTEAYRWLAAKMNKKSAHISEMGQSECYRVQEIANKFLIDKLFT